MFSECPALIAESGLVTSDGMPAFLAEPLHLPATPRRGHL